MLKKLFLSRNDINDVEMMREKKEFSLRTLVLGNGVTDFAAVECSQCYAKFTDFDFTYVKYTNDYQACCPKCKADITQTTFYPLDKHFRRI